MIETIGVLTASAWAWMNLVEPFRPVLRHRDVHLPNLPPDLDDFTILHLSDLHTRRMGLLERKVRCLLGQTSAHIAVLTGDLVDSERGIAPLMELLSAVQTTIGIFAVWGNSEHKPSRLTAHDVLAEQLQSVGVHLLNNESTLLTYQGHRIYLAGVDDPHSGHADIERVTPASRYGVLHLLLAHSPDVLLHPLSSAFHLILCGHTHCGQIRIPRWGALWSHTRLGRWAGDPLLTPEQIARRLHRAPPQPHVVVSPGIATVGVPLFTARLFCPPEVTLLHLRRQRFCTSAYTEEGFSSSGYLTSTAVWMMRATPSVVRSSV